MWEGLGIPAEMGSSKGIVAGTFGECGSEAEVQAWMRYNIFLLLEVGMQWQSGTCEQTHYLQIWA